MNSLAKRLALLTTLVCALTASAFAADIAGKWKTDFETPVGHLHYLYTFAVDGEKLTGTAKNDFGETPIVDGKINGDEISFVENFSLQGQEIKITYTGKLTGDEIKFTRHPGDFPPEEFVATRQQ